MDGILNYFKEALRSIGEYIQEEYSSPDAIGDGLEAISISTDDIREEVQEYMRKNPNATKKQADVVVAYRNGLISTKGYQAAVQLLMDQNEWEKE